MSGAPADRMGGQRAEVRDRSTAHSTAAAAGSGPEGRAAEAFEQADSLAKARALKSVDRRECSLEPFALLLHLLLLHMLGLQRRTRDEHSSVSMPGIPNGTALDGEESERWGATDKALRGCARSSWQLTCIAPAIARGLDSSGKPRQVLAAVGLREPPSWSHGLPWSRRRSPRPPQTSTPRPPDSPVRACVLCSCPRLRFGGSRMIHSDRTLDTEHDSPRKTRLPTTAGANAARTYDPTDQMDKTCSTACSMRRRRLRLVSRPSTAASSPRHRPPPEGGPPNRGRSRVEAKEAASRPPAAFVS